MLLHQIKAAFGFTLLESLSAWGWNMTVRTYRKLIHLAVAAFAFLLCLSSAVAFEALEKTYGLGVISSESRTLLVALFFVIPVSYLGAAAVVRESLSSRRLIVIYSPHRTLFKAIDIPIAAVYAAHCLPRIAMLGISYAALLVGFLRSWFSHLARYPELLGLVIVIPVLFLLFFTYVSSHNATVLPRRTQKNLWLLLLLATLTGVASYHLSYWAHEILSSPIAIEKFVTLDFLLRALPVVFTPLLLTTLSLLFLTIQNIRRMQHAIFAPQTPLPTRHRVQAPGNTRVPSWWLVTAITRSLRCHPSFTLATRFFALTFLLAVTVIGAVLGGLAIDSLQAGPIINAVLLLAYVAGLTLSEHIGKVIGALSLIPRLRFCYESGLSRCRLAGIGLGTETALNTVFLLPCFCAAQLIFGGYTFFVLFLIPMAITAAATFATAVLASSRPQADGTQGDSLLAAFITILLSTPVIAMLTVNTAFFHLLALLWTLALSGGAVLCLSKRIRSIPCYL